MAAFGNPDPEQRLLQLAAGRREVRPLVIAGRECSLGLLAGLLGASKPSTLRSGPRTFSLAASACLALLLLTSCARSRISTDPLTQNSIY